MSASPGDPGVNAIDVRAFLLEGMNTAWMSLARRLEGLGDEEYFWEPVENCWSIRVRDDASAVADFAPIPPYPPPFTTIAWRLAHIGQSLLSWTDRQFGNRSFDYASIRWPATAVDGVAFVEAGHEAWTEGVRRAEKLDLSLGWMANHVREHGAEIGVIRDLFWHTHKSDAFVAACIEGNLESIERIQAQSPGILERTISRHPGLTVNAAEHTGAAAMRVLLDLGFPVNPGGPVSPLHKAAELGDLALVQVLVKLGADISNEDTLYNSTALGWAQFAGHTDVASYLAQVHADQT